MEWAATVRWDEGTQSLSLSTVAPTLMAINKPPSFFPTTRKKIYAHAWDERQIRERNTLIILTSGKRVNAHADAWDETDRQRDLKRKREDTPIILTNRQRVHAHAYARDETDRQIDREIERSRERERERERNKEKGIHLPSYPAQPRRPLRGDRYSPDSPSRYADSSEAWWSSFVRPFPISSLLRSWACGLFWKFFSRG